MSPWRTYSVIFVTGFPTYVAVLDVVGREAGGMEARARLWEQLPLCRSASA